MPKRKANQISGYDADSEYDANSDAAASAAPAHPVSSYTGVSWHSGMDAWMAQYKTNGRSYYIGCFADEQMAALYRNLEVAISPHIADSRRHLFYNELGAPDPGYVEMYREHMKTQKPSINLDNHTPEQTATAFSICIARAANKRGNTISTSQYRGVSYSHAREKWMASMTFEGKNIYLGAYFTAEAAAAAYNQACMHFTNKRINYIQTTRTCCPYKLDAGGCCSRNPVAEPLVFSTPPPRLFADLNLGEQSTDEEQPQLVTTTTTTTTPCRAATPLASEMELLDLIESLEFEHDLIASFDIDADIKEMGRNVYFRL